MYESGISFELTDEMTGAASLWVVPTLKSGDEAASSGSSVVKLMRDFMMAVDERGWNRTERGRAREERDGD